MFEFSVGPSSTAFEGFFVVPLAVAAFSNAVTMLRVGPVVGATARRAGMLIEGIPSTTGVGKGTVSAEGSSVEVFFVVPLPVSAAFSDTGTMLRAGGLGGARGVVGLRGGEV